jgi:hypothetical protein
MRNFPKMFLRARQALEFSHGQDPKRTSVPHDNGLSYSLPCSGNVLAFRFGHRHKWVLAGFEIASGLISKEAHPKYRIRYLFTVGARLPITSNGHVPGAGG